MPLELFVPSLRRVVALPASSQAPHSLHSLLDPLLQTTRTISNKYHVELVQILQDGGGDGELEESVMWYALHHEKTGGREPTGRCQDPWTNEKWRQDWLERLERREYVLSFCPHAPMCITPTLLESRDSNSLVHDQAFASWTASRR